MFVYSTSVILGKIIAPKTSPTCHGGGAKEFYLLHNSVAFRTLLLSPLHQQQK